MGFLKTFFPDYFSHADRRSALVGFLISTSTLIALLKTNLPAHVDRIPLARLESFSNDVRHKDMGSASLYDVLKKEQFQNNDEIFTGEDSVATVKFLNSATTLKIPKLSLIVIKTNENKDALELKYGMVDILIAKDQVINLKSGETYYPIRSNKKASTLRAYYLLGKLHLFTLDSGIKIKGPKGENELVANHDMILDVNGLKRDLKFILLSPIPGEKLDGTEGIKIRTNRSSKYNVTLSKQNDFSKPNYKTQFEGLSKEWEKTLEEGEYFLKIENKKDVTIVPITLASKYKIDGISPGDGELLNINPGEKTIFSWNPLLVNSYKINMRGNHGKEKTYLVNSNQLAIKNLKGSEIEWTILPKVASGRYSNIKKTNHVRLKFNGKIEFIGLSLKPIYKTSENKIDFSWTGQKEEQFSVTVWDLKDQKKIFVRKPKKASISVPIKTIGAYKIEVTSLDYPSLQGAEYNYEVIKPILTWNSKLPQKIKSTEEDETITLAFKENYDFGSNASLLMNYIPVKSKLIEKKPIERKMRLENIAKVKLEGFGQYCFKGVLDTPVEYFGDSEDYCLELIQIPVFPHVPRAKNAIMAYTKLNGLDSYKIKVPTIKKATKYHFELYAESSGKTLVYAADSNTHEVFWTTNRSGIYYLKYKVFDAKNRESRFSNFTKLIFPISPLSDW